MTVPASPIRDDADGGPMSPVQVRVRRDARLTREQRREAREALRREEYRTAALAGVL